MCNEPTNWEKCVGFHGHECPGLAFGYKVSVIAMQELGVRKSADEELVAIVENDACGVDAIQVLTGCTFGKGNLIFKDFGKHVFTFGNRKTGEAVRISVKTDIMQSNTQQKELQDKIKTGAATSEEKALFLQLKQQKMHYILNSPIEEFCKVEKIKLDFPRLARSFKSIICEVCGEGTAEPRVRVKNGKMVCLECLDAHKHHNFV